MEANIQELFDQLNEKDNTVRYEAFTRLLEITENPVKWVYEVWDLLVGKLDNPNSFQRSIGIMLLCNLSHSDKEKRMNAIVTKVLSHTRDEKFITSRQTLQNCWKIAWFNSSLSETILTHLKERFLACETEDHANLLRQDILQSLVTLTELQHDEPLETTVRELINSEKNEKSQKGYLALIDKK